MLAQVAPVTTVQVRWSGYSEHHQRGRPDVDDDDRSDRIFTTTGEALIFWAIVGLLMWYFIIKGVMRLWEAIG